MEPKKTVFEDRTEYRLDGRLHREDGPAIIWNNGDEFWFLNDQRHRENGPAVDRKYGYQAWYQFDKLHREDGPALIDPDGIHQEWHVRGMKLGNIEYAFMSDDKTKKEHAKLATKILSGEYPFIDLPLLINHPVLKYFASHVLQHGIKSGGENTRDQ